MYSHLCRGTLIPVKRFLHPLLSSSFEQKCVTQHGHYSYYTMYRTFSLRNAGHLHSERNQCPGANPIIFNYSQRIGDLLAHLKLPQDPARQVLRLFLSVLI